MKKKHTLAKVKQSVKLFFFSFFKIKSGTRDFAEL